jgi:glycosyltransferase involved in cell wall biosynthesis
MKIRLIGFPNQAGNDACFGAALKQIRLVGALVEKIDSEDKTAVQAAARESQPEDINISLVAANIHEFFQGHNIQWTSFESTRVPEHIMSTLYPAEQVWVSSTWGKNILVANGIAERKIHVIPQGVDGNLYHAHGRKIWNPSRPYRFLMVGKYQQQNSFDEALEAFAQAHGNRPDLELVIKTDYLTNQDENLLKLRKKISSLGLTNVNILWEELGVEQMADLYRSCDAFVLPTKGESWAPPLMEAAASGMTLITVSYSGHTEYSKKISNSVLTVDYVMADVGCPEYQNNYPDKNNAWGKWARPDVFSIAACMQAACREYEHLYKTAQANSLFVRQQYSWQNSADQALVAMSKLPGWTLPSVA